MSRFERGGEGQLNDQDIREKISSLEARKLELQDKLSQSMEGTDEYKR